MKKELIQIIEAKAKEHNLSAALLMSFVETESGGEGFDSKTGKILIQFEPAWFKKREPYAPSGKWSVNKVDRQEAEWIAFNDAFKISPKSAMESTSIGLPQIMGGNYKLCGFKTVDDFWDYMKIGLAEHIECLIRFIKNSPNLFNAFQSKNFHLMAVYYNGAGYQELAKKLKREPYNITLEKNYNKYLKLGYK